MSTIGDFSKITRLTAKTLRFYHVQGLLIPSYVDPGNGYRSTIQKSNSLVSSPRYVNVKNHRRRRPSSNNAPRA